MTNTLNHLLEEAIKGENTRQNLSLIRQEIKDETRKELFRSFAKTKINDIILFFKNEDAKTRKNAALLMGDLGFTEFCKPLFDGYVAEQTLFVKTAYLTALQSFDVQEFLPELQNILEQLTHIPLTAENKKHVENEIRAISTLIVMEEGISHHSFKGFTSTVECILMANRNLLDVTASQITDGTIIPYRAGVRVRTKNVSSLLPIRTYQEILFLIPDYIPCKMDPVAIASKLSDSKLLSMLQKSHNGTAPFYFRIELKSKMPLNKKSSFAKKVASEIELLTNRKLINSPKDYEIELRLIENKEGTCNALLKLYTIPDDRFSYRKETTPTSIKPVNAALLVALAKPYMKKDATVLDPFCGVGTMLIERQKVVKANTSYGIDILEDSINKAKKNTESAQQIIHFINKNFFDFTHEYKFDEIFTDMPFAIGKKTEEDITEIYERFFLHVKKLLKTDGIIILYTRNRNLVRKLAGKNGFRIEKEWEIQHHEKTSLFVLR